MLQNKRFIISFVGSLAILVLFSGKVLLFSGTDSLWVDISSLGDDEERLESVSLANAKTNENSDIPIPAIPARAQSEINTTSGNNEPTETLAYSNEKQNDKELNTENRKISKKSKKSTQSHNAKPEVTSNTGQEAIVYSTTSETSDSTTTAIPIIVASIGPTATQSGNGQSTTTTSATESSSVASSTPLASEEISKEEQTEESTQTESSQKYSEFFKPGDHATTSLAVDPYEEVSEIPPGTGKGDDSASQGLLESGAIQAEFYPDELIIFNPETCDVLSSSAPEQFTDLTFGELEISGDPTLHKLNFAIPAPALMEGITEGGELSVVVGIFREEGASYTRLVTLIWRDLPREISSLSTFNFSVSHSRIFVWDHAIRTRVMLWGNTLEACVNPDGLMKFAINVPVGEGLIFPIPDRISGRPDGEVRSVEKTLSLKSYEDKDY
ncbi:MAG: hypothetical protein A3F16_03790 [Deltaproteobacteria bacterium RIFCSPHIGHO2_12_FULL_43_9]|nr:MAG: hypothetical protein A3F16_03790 [Deltaproteobacteria bacterium RIFCSPHIGHO2_12_FULL_43_9]